MQGRGRENNKKCSGEQASFKKVGGNQKTTLSKENCGSQKTNQLQERKNYEAKTFNRQ